MSDVCAFGLTAIALAAYTFGGIDTATFWSALIVASLWRIEGKLAR